MFSTRSQSNICEEEAKFVQKRIGTVEKHFAELSTIFAAFARNAARLRDKNDEVSGIIQNYAEAENINRSLINGLLNFATTLSVIGDYRDARVNRIEAKVILPLSQYSIICKHVREGVENTFKAREKELAKRSQLDKLREKNPRDSKISQAESEHAKARVEVTRFVKGLEDQIDNFEKRKLRDLKTILADFVRIELSFHTKAVELLTKAYQDVAEIDEAKDLEEFREVMRVPDSVARLGTVRRASFRQSYSLTNLASRFHSPMSLKKEPVRKGSSDSIKTGYTNSSESVQMEEYDKSCSDDTESESTMRGKPKKIFKSRYYRRKPRNIELRTIPAIPSYQKSLTSSIIHSVSYA